MITQTEFENLLRQEKEFDNYDPINLGPAPIEWTRKINSASSKDSFLFDFYRGSFELTKYKYNKRFRQTVIMLRYDSHGRHTNPDGVFLDGPHVHLYREDYNDKFAFPVSEIGVNESDTMEIVLQKILHFCNVKRIPSVNISMF